MNEYMEELAHAIQKNYQGEKYIEILSTPQLAQKCEENLLTLLTSDYCVLNKREQEAIKLRYLFQLTLENISITLSSAPKDTNNPEYIGVFGYRTSRQNVHVIIQKAIKKIANDPMSMRIICLGMKEAEKIHSMKKDVIQEYARLRLIYEELKSVSNDDAFKVKVKQLLDGENPQSIYELDLSVRSSNCLRRSGITTIQALLNVGVKNLINLRNLGKKSTKEIIAKVHSFGLKFIDEQ